MADYKSLKPVPTFASRFEKGVDLGFHTLEYIATDGLLPHDQVEKFVGRQMAIIPTMMAMGSVFDEEEVLKLVETRQAEYVTPEAARQTAARIRTSLAQEKRKPSPQEKRGLTYDTGNRASDPRVGRKKFLALVRP